MHIFSPKKPAKMPLRSPRSPHKIHSTITITTTIFHIFHPHLIRPPQLANIFIFQTDRPITFHVLCVKKPKIMAKKPA